MVRVPWPRGRLEKVLRLLVQAKRTRSITDRGETFWYREGSIGAAKTPPGLRHQPMTGAGKGDLGGGSLCTEKVVLRNSGRWLATNLDEKEALDKFPAAEVKNDTEYLEGVVSWRRCRV